MNVAEESGCDGQEFGRIIHERRNEMRYSEILGDAFYKISLAEPVRDMIDVHYTASAHHFWRLQEQASSETRRFHLLRHRAHLRAMMSLVYLHGNFANAIDQSFRDLDKKESWNPNNSYLLPDPKMFNSMNPHPEFKANEDHPSDIYISNEHFVGGLDH